MHREGHIGAALLVYSPVGFVAFVAGFQGLAVLGAVGAGGLAMLPDYDQKVPGVSHRGLTHTVWFAGLVGLLIGAVGLVGGISTQGPFAGLGLGLFGTIVGGGTILSHIAADALTPMGVEPYTPFRDDHYTYDIARASNPLANYGLLALGLATTAIALAVGNALRSL